jgi:hypothetical protein
MPELTWTIALAWFGVLSGAASVASLVFGQIMGRQTSRLQADIHASTQLTLADMRKGFSESHERLAESQKAIAEAIGGVSHTQAAAQQSLANIAQILERMDQRAEERYRDLRGRIDGEV